MSGADEPQAKPALGLPKGCAAPRGPVSRDRMRPPTPCSLFHVPCSNDAVLILGIETSCDETAVGIVADGRRLLANVVASQAAIHARYGGVVPEGASRPHLAAVPPVGRAAS